MFTIHLAPRLGKVHVECTCVCRTSSFGVNKQTSNSHLTGSWSLERKAMERAVMSPGVIGVSDLLEDELGVLVRLSVCSMGGLEDELVRLGSCSSGGFCMTNTNTIIEPSLLA